MCGVVVIHQAAHPAGEPGIAALNSSSAAARSVVRNLRHELTSAVTVPAGAPTFPAQDRGAARGRGGGASWIAVLHQVYHTFRRASGLTGTGPCPGVPGTT